MRIKKRKPSGIKEFPLHVLIEKKQKVVRAHCVEFDLAVTAENSEQAMVRMERLIDCHLKYARENNSNPVYMADLEIVQKWMAPPSQSSKAWILVLVFADRKSKPKITKYEHKVSQLQQYEMA